MAVTKHLANQLSWWCDLYLEMAVRPDSNWRSEKMRPPAQVEHPSPTVTANLPSMVQVLGKSGLGGPLARGSIINRIKCCSLNFVTCFSGLRQLSPQLRLISCPIQLLLLLSLVLSPLLLTSVVAYGSAGTHSRKLSFLCSKAADYL